MFPPPPVGGWGVGRLFCLPNGKESINFGEALSPQLPESTACFPPVHGMHEAVGLDPYRDCAFGFTCEEIECHRPGSISWCSPAIPAALAALDGDGLSRIAVVHG